MVDSTLKAAPTSLEQEQRAEAPQMDLAGRRTPHNWRNLAARVIWGVVYVTLFRTSPRPLRRWRNFLLRLFGAHLHPTANVYPRAKVWLPRNLSMDAHSCLADEVDCYCVDRIHIGAQTVISQYTYLCGATHDFEDSTFPLRPGPIIIEDQAWVAADVFVGPNVRIGQGAVVGARSTVLSDLPPWKVCVGTPAKPVKDRVLKR